MSGDSGPGPRDGGDWRLWLRRVIFGHDTAAGKAFDVVLILAILISVTVVMLDSVERYALRHGQALRRAEWAFTIMFTIEYLLRLFSAPSARKYATSFYGVIDLLAVLPSYLALFFPGGRYLISIRILRILRVFRVLKLAQFVGGERVIIDALKASRHKIAVFLITVLTVVVVVGHPLRGGGNRGRLHEHTAERLLGHRDPHHRRIRGYRAADALRADARVPDHGPRIRHDCGPDGYRDGGDGGGVTVEGGPAHVRGMWPAPPRPRRRVLQELRPRARS
jgi:hypothetical protein